MLRRPERAEVRLPGSGHGRRRSANGNGGNDGSDGSHALRHRRSKGLDQAQRLVLRWRQPDLPRPYRTWGYPVTPLIFLAISLWILFFQLRDKPMESLAGLATMALGLIIYFLSPKTASTSVPPTATP